MQQLLCRSLQWNESERYGRDAGAPGSVEETYRADGEQRFRLGPPPGFPSVDTGIWR